MTKPQDHKLSVSHLTSSQAELEDGKASVNMHKVLLQKAVEARAPRRQSYQVHFTLELNATKPPSHKQPPACQTPTRNVTTWLGGISEALTSGGCYVCCCCAAAMVVLLLMYCCCIVRAVTINMNTLLYVRACIIAYVLFACNHAHVRGF